jgi:hypothetical protein
MQRNFQTAIPWIFFPFIMGCAIAEPYVPNRPPVPLITHQGELNVSGGVHFPSASGFDYDAVYAPWNHISTYAALQFDRGNAYSSTAYRTSEPSNYYNHFFEIGLGYFDSIHWAHYEAYLLAGLGTGFDHQNDFRYYSIYSSSSAYTDTTSLHAYRLGVQQNIGIGSSINTSGGVGLGLGYERLFNLNRNVTNYSLTQTSQSDDSVSSSASSHETASQSAFYAEPLIFCSLGVPVAVDGTELFNIRCTVEIWWSYRTNSYPSFGSWNESLSLSLGF